MTRHGTCIHIEKFKTEHWYFSWRLCDAHLTRTNANDISLHICTVVQSKILYIYRSALPDKSSSSGYNWVCSHQSPFVSIPPPTLPLQVPPTPPLPPSPGGLICPLLRNTQYSVDFTDGGEYSLLWRGSEQHQGEVNPSPHMRGFWVRGLGGVPNKQWATKIS